MVFFLVAFFFVAFFFATIANLQYGWLQNVRIVGSTVMSVNDFPRVHRDPDVRVIKER